MCVINCFRGILDIYMDVVLIVKYKQLSAYPVASGEARKCLTRDNCVGVNKIPSRSNGKGIF